MHSSFDDIIGDQVFATVGEAAQVLRLDQRTIRRGIANGTVPSVRVGESTRIPTGWLKAAAGLEVSV